MTTEISVTFGSLWRKTCALFGVRSQAAGPRGSGHCETLSPFQSVMQYIFATLKPQQIERLAPRCKSGGFLRLSAPRHRARCKNPSFRCRHPVRQYPLSALSTMDCTLGFKG